MKIRVVIILLGIACLAGYATVVWNTSDSFSRSPSVPLASALPKAVAALAGTWEGLGSYDLPAKLVVENIRERWATVRYAWGEHPEGKFHEGWVRVRAVVFPDGRLYWRHPGDFTFQLSEDWTTLMGKREHGGATATSLMRRVSGGAAITTLNAMPALVAQTEGNAMPNAVLTMIGWGLFYWMVCLYVFWVLAERTFFAGSDPERWEPHPQTDATGPTREAHRPAARFPYVPTLDRPA